MIEVKNCMYAFSQNGPIGLQCIFTVEFNGCMDSCVRPPLDYLLATQLCNAFRRVS